jgi:glutamate dehydrogenase
MALRAEQLKAELVDGMLQQVRERVAHDKVDITLRFVRQFTANIPPADMVAATAERLYGAALALWQFGAVRAPRTPLLRVFSPQIDRDSWQSRHSVVEVVNDDMPFLVGSLTEALQQEGLTVHLVIHPVLRGRRDEAGRLVALYEPGMAPPDAPAESFIHLTIDRLTSPERVEAVRSHLLRALGDVRLAVEDWRAMRAAAAEVMADLRSRSQPGPADEFAETADFLAWLGDDHFTFLGYRIYRFVGADGRAGAEGATRLEIQPGSGLGVLRDPAVVVFDGLRDLDSLPPEVQFFLRLPQVLRVTKTNRRATVHRAVHQDAILVKAFDDDGVVIGERLFVGLFTSAAYARMVRDVPFLRRKVARVITRAGFNPQGHDGRRLVHILSSLPRDELYQSSDDELLDLSMGVLHLQERLRVALFVRADPFKRFVSCLVFLPRDRYDTALRKTTAQVLERAFRGTLSAYYIQVSDGPLARLHVIVRTTPAAFPDYDVRDIEAQLVEAARGWSDRLREALVEARGEEAGLGLFERYGEAFPVGYRESTAAETAVYDIGRIEEVTAGGGMAITLYRPLEAEAHEVRFKIYHRGAPVPLSDMLPLLETLDLKVVTELPFAVRPAGVGTVWLHDFQTESRSGAAIDLERDRLTFQDAFTRLWTGEIEADGFNRLVLRAGLSWREVVILRAEAKYLRQVRIPFSQDYLEATLAGHPEIARLIVELFLARLDPRRPDDWLARSDRLVEAIGVLTDRVRNLEEDTILRRFVNLTLATLRTNYFQLGADGQPKPYLALKLDSQALDDLPLPRPLVEVFVYSPRVEAIHLRGGKVARGGIRWSDRREDFRTEILGLMKAQMVKNAVIVPVGSKGGFVVKRPPPVAEGREAAQAEGVACYRTLMSGLLDLTDTLAADGAVMAPPEVVRFDGDDPYLVVAADKGTASFSDIANGIAHDYGFWLDDAFASGGSVGYDHKKMGITARGAWESVKRHFRECGHDIQTQPFTCVGVGDMAGDVFGNGMLLSRSTRLLAAFNHQHIFCDPDPDPALSFEERGRLAALPRSAWSDYDPTRLSPGGRVYDRSAKLLTLSSEIQARFSIKSATVTPNQLIRILLTADVDLLWFGGIGTFVKAHGESQADAGDKANDAVRVDARELRAKVIGEGANLAMTQPARVEAAQRRGIRLNTDAIDNSAGVDCSDHEVNIKILLGDVVASGDLTLKQRNQMLADMTGEVAALVLADNYLQVQALSVAEATAAERIDEHVRFMRALERAGHLNRAVENLPDDEAVAARKKERQGLTRPELAVLLAYAKITLYDDVLASDLPDDPWMARDLVRYFPHCLHQRFPEVVARHRLRREIIATGVTNSLVNRAGPAFVREMIDKTGARPGDIARAYAVVRDVFDLRPLWRAIEALDGTVAVACQIAMIQETQRLLDRAVAWFLGHGRQPLDIAGEINTHRPAIEALGPGLEDLLGSGERVVLSERIAALGERGVPAELARRVGLLPVLAPVMDVVRIAGARGAEVAAVAAIYYQLGERFGLNWLRRRARKIPAGDHWQFQAVNAMVDDLYGQQTDLTWRVLEGRLPDGGAAGIVDDWCRGRQAAVDRVALLLAELRSVPDLDLARLAVASRQIRALTGS